MKRVTLMGHQTNAVTSRIRECNHEPHYTCTCIHMQFKSKKNSQPLLKPEYSVSFLMLELKDNETKGNCTSQSSEDSDFEDDDQMLV